jgi:hypothetical protein
VGAGDGLPKLKFASAAEWQAWLEANHASSEGVWLKIAEVQRAKADGRWEAAQGQV